MFRRVRSAEQTENTMNIKRKIGTMVLAALTVSAPLGAFGAAPAHAASMTNWYSTAGGPSVSLNVVCNDHRALLSDQGSATFYANVYRTVPLQYAQSYAWRTWVQTGDGAWFHGAWHYGTIAANASSGYATEYWNVDVVGPRLTSGWESGDTKAHAAFEGAVVSSGTWHSTGVIAADYGFYGGTFRYPHCYI
jgi:hypothetical protein